MSENRNSGESVREMLNQRSTEKVLSRLQRPERTQEEREAFAAFLRSKRRRKRPWK